MTSFVRKHKLILLSVAAGCYIGWNLFCGHAAGYLQANVDLALGKPKYIGFGLPMYPDSMLARVLTDQYAIQFKRIAGCVVTSYEVDYAASYNAVVNRFLRRKYHRDIWENVDKKLSELSRESRATEAR